jgi:hypothetical protein
MKLIRLILSVAFLSASVAAPALANASDDKTVSVQVNSDRNAIWLKTRAKSWDTEHRTWVQRGGYVGFRVPDDKYSLYFGPEHVFRINTLPYREIQGQPYYQYNGYWMRVVDPWPESWPEGWYDNDDVYVRYDNGYYLYNQRYPGIGLSLEFAK